ncbi:hypothetical protein VW23_025750 [Devosia insulae DS-56]|uniref:Uncharacterized protein n=1 Tax=Devosia insulae DS-56 TaxID=1116389 RepID=A0A1E5XLH1_9HYPH|nr:hypothetical protein [Devosia insulae]OEO29428.1 hypothetical protein VW23_025750 [Devosia insulae DS-56]
MGKSWTEKLNAPAEPVVKPAPISIAGMRAGQIMLVPTARMIADFMSAIPPGQTVDTKAMRRALAERHHAEVTCPIYTGYHLRTVAEAALEAYAAGMPVEAITPFWRVLDDTSPTTDRLPNGPAFVATRRAAEA